MKRSLIIYGLFLLASFILSSSTHAQQQKKPSERSFTSEINKVKQIQAARNSRISQLQQPTDPTTIVEYNNSKPGTTPTTNKINPNSSKDLPQQSTITKPSATPMKQPKKPAVTSGISN
jgi:hypothetical protein